MPAKVKSLFTLYPPGRAAGRDVNRLRLLGMTALAVCLAIAAYGLYRQQDAISTSEQTQNMPWTSTR